MRGESTETTTTATITIGSHARFDCTNILFIVAEVIFALVFVRRFTSVIYDM